MDGSGETLRGAGRSGEIRRRAGRSGPRRRLWGVGLGPGRAPRPPWARPGWGSPGGGSGEPGVCCVAERYFPEEKRRPNPVPGEVSVAAGPRERLLPAGPLPGVGPASAARPTAAPRPRRRLLPLPTPSFSWCCWSEHPPFTKLMFLSQLTNQPLHWEYPPRLSLAMPRFLTPTPNLLVCSKAGASLSLTRSFVQLFTPEK